MKESVITGKTIYEEIKDLKKELDEFDQALESVRDDIGEDSAAYKLLYNASQDKEKVLDQALLQRYDKEVRPPFPFGS